MASAYNLTWFDFKNDEEEKIPPHSVIELKGDHKVNGISTSIVKAGKPSSDGSGVYALTGSMATKSEGFGRCTRSDFAYVTYDGDEQPEMGAEMGITDDEWPVKEGVGESIFIVAGKLELEGDEPTEAEKKVRVVRLGGSAGTELAVTTTAIPAADWDSVPPKLGKGTVQLWRIKPHTGAGDPPDPPELEKVTRDDGNGGTEDATEDWYNIVPSAVKVDRVVKRDLLNGRKIIDLESCVQVDV